MSSKIRHTVGLKKHEVPQIPEDPSSSSEEGILVAKLLELENAHEQFKETLQDLFHDDRLSEVMHDQLSLNSEQMIEDAQKHAEKAKKSKFSMDYRFAMGWIEGSIEWMNKPLVPIAS